MCRDPDFTLKILVIPELEIQHFAIACSQFSELKQFRLPIFQPLDFHFYDTAHISFISFHLGQGQAEEKAALFLGGLQMKALYPQPGPGISRRHNALVECQLLAQFHHLLAQTRILIAHLARSAPVDLAGTLENRKLLLQFSIGLLQCLVAAFNTIQLLRQPFHSLTGIAYTGLKQQVS